MFRNINSKKELNAFLNLVDTTHLDEVLTEPELFSSEIIPIEELNDTQFVRIMDFIYLLMNEKAFPHLHNKILKLKVRKGYVLTIHTKWRTLYTYVLKNTDEMNWNDYEEALKNFCKDFDLEFVKD